MVNRRRAAALLLVSIAAGIVPAGLDVTTAGAVTDSCQNTPRPEWGAVGCGALFLPQVNYPGAGPALTLSALANQFLSPVIVKPMNQGAAQDFTWYQVCSGISGNRSAESPCGTGRAIPGQFVAEFTPFGDGHDINSQRSLCLTDSGGRVLLANCQAGNAWYQPGFPQPPVTDGSPPVVAHPAAAETWQVSPAGKVVNGYSGRVLADPGSGGPGTRLVTSSGGGPGAAWQVTGCTAPVSSMPKGFFYGCITRG